MKNKLITIIATFFFVGKIPVSPGTVASLIALILWFCFPTEWHIWKAIGTIILIVVGVLSAGWIEKRTSEKDPSMVVIDEVAGMWLTMTLLPGVHFHGNVWMVISAFALFRFFDISKFPPINQLEKLRGGWGIVADDLLAGVYAAIFINTVRWIT
ncbi:MAG: phosphatidylglycerophosphatase A [Candidatus Neomarinimicrobiota bacterium]